MKNYANIVRITRLEAGLTQTELARRMGTTQSAVARLESAGSSPSLRTLDRALAAMGSRLVVDAQSQVDRVDQAGIVEALRQSPGDRLRRLTAGKENLDDLLSSARSSA